MISLRHVFFVFHFFVLLFLFVPVIALAKSPYEVLGIPSSSSKEEIEKAWKKIARQYHPDTNRDNPSAAARFKEASAAHDILKDPVKKAAFDRFGDAAFSAGSAHAARSQEAANGFDSHFDYGYDPKYRYGFDHDFDHEFDDGRDPRFDPGFDGYDGLDPRFEDQAQSGRTSREGNASQSAILQRLREQHQRKLVGRPPTVESLVIAAFHVINQSFQMPFISGDMTSIAALAAASQFIEEEILSKVSEHSEYHLRSSNIVNSILREVLSGQPLDPYKLAKIPGAMEYHFVEVIFQRSAMEKNMTDSLALASAILQDPSFTYDVGTTKQTSAQRKWEIETLAKVVLKDKPFENANLRVAVYDAIHTATQNLIKGDSFQALSKEEQKQVRKISERSAISLGLRCALGAKKALGL